MALETIKIADGAYRVEHGMVRSILFTGQNCAALVDTGFGEGGLKDAVTAVTDKRVVLIISHADGDHTGGSAEFGTAHMHPSEFAHYRASNPDAPVAPLWEGDIIDLGGRKLEVILIPGHTPGSIALLDRENRVIVTGDSVSMGPIFMFGEQRDIRAYIASMKKLDALSGAFDEIYTSHGDFPAPVSQIRKSIIAAQKLLTGELEGQDSPFPGGAKVYTHDGAGFLY